MGNYQYYLFDLDGTLTDSGEGIMNSIRHALHKFGITEYEETTLRKFIGPPLAECFQKYFDLSPGESIITGNIILTGECLKMRSIMA